MKPQTLEHLAILDLLGVDHGVVALTKADLASRGAHRGRGEAREGDAGGHDARACRCPAGLGDDGARRGRAARASRNRRRSRSATVPPGTRFRLAVDRVFTLAGVGVVATGTVLSGSVRVGDRVQISPSGLMARVRSVHAQNAEAEIARAADRCALNLAGPDVAKDAIRRGDVVLDPELHAPTDRIDALLRAVAQRNEADRPVVSGPPPSRSVGGRRADRPARATDRSRRGMRRRFSSRSIGRSPRRPWIASSSATSRRQRTLGGGVFLDLRPPARKRRTPERQAQRAALAIRDPARVLRRASGRAAFRRGPRRLCPRPRSFRRATRTSSRRPSISSSSKPRTRGCALARERWGIFASAALDRIAAYHPENPDLQGMGRDELRLALRPRLPKQAFDAALQRLARANELVLDGAFVRLPSHEVRLTDEDMAAWEIVAPLLGGEERFRPPRVRDIAAATGRAGGRRSADPETAPAAWAGRTRSRTTISSCARPCAKWSGSPPI